MRSPAAAFLRGLSYRKRVLPTLLLLLKMQPPSATWPLNVATQRNTRDRRKFRRRVCFLCSAFGAFLLFACSNASFLACSVWTGWRKWRPSACGRLQRFLQEFGDNGRPPSDLWVISGCYASLAVGGTNFRQCGFRDGRRHFAVRADSLCVQRS